ncbi:hypothetical protein [Streptomyces sp. JJ36]|uniref:hypothetical protein n=1 Tax=Streptomyces sp. JJ36 TaxID=2736645 RepID=UPI001F1CBD88|nr:hypothetical protein [Streptomyces sp. JJ36]
MEFVIGVVALIFALCVVLGVIATVRTVRAVRRGVERTTAQVRRTVEDTSLKARTAQPGPVGEVARVRLELRSSIDSTRTALQAAAPDDPSLREALGLLDRLHEHARQLDGELRLLMEREPDRARVAERLPDARERARAIRESADSLRFAAQDRARQYDADGLASLRDQIEIESGALRGWQEPPLPGGRDRVDGLPDGRPGGRTGDPAHRDATAREAASGSGGQAADPGGERALPGRGADPGPGLPGTGLPGTAGRETAEPVPEEPGRGERPRNFPDLGKGRPQGAS